MLLVELNYLLMIPKFILPSRTLLTPSFTTELRPGQRMVKQMALKVQC